MNLAVSGAARVLAAIGTGWDASARMLRTTGGHVRAAFAVRRSRRIGMLAGSGVLLLYLLSTGDIAVSLSGRYAALSGWQLEPDGLFRARAPYLFEPVLAAPLGSHVALFLNPINVLLGLIVAAFVSANIALVVRSTQTLACRRPGYTRVLGVLPAFLLGFACCVPTFALALGAGTAAAVLPVLLPLRPVFYPLTLVLLLTALIWGARRMERLTREPELDEPRPVSAQQWRA